MCLSLGDFNFVGDLHRVHEMFMHANRMEQINLAVERTGLVMSFAKSLISQLKILLVFLESIRKQCNRKLATLEQRSHEWYIELLKGPFHKIIE